MLQNLVRAVVGAAQLVAAIFWLHASCTSNAHAQCEPQVNAFAGPGQGLTGGYCTSVLVLPSGEVIASGPITGAGGIPVSGIAIFDPGSESWAPLGSGLSGYAHEMVRLPNGAIVVGGAFSTAGGIAANRVALFNPATNAWHPAGAGVNGTVYSLASLPTGEIVVGGYFTTAGGAAANCIALFDPATGVWRALGVGLNGRVSAIAVLPSGEIVAGGEFTSAGGVPAGRIAKFNLATNSWSPLGSGVAGSVRDLVVTPAGLLFASGNFSSVDGVAALGVASYDPTTHTWRSVGSNVTSTGPLALLPDGRVVSSPLGIHDPGTDTWTRLDGEPAFAGALATTPDGDIIAGGSFWNIDGPPYNQGGPGTEYGIGVNRVARYSLATSTWSPLGRAAYGSPYASMELSDGTLLVAGTFTRVSNVDVGRIAMYNDEEGWSTLGTGLDGAVRPPTNQGSVRALAETQDGSIFAAGDFTSAGGVPAVSIARYNRTTGEWSALNGSITDGPIFTLANHPSGQLVVGGRFYVTRAPSQLLASRIGLYDPEADAWTSMVRDFPGTIYCAAALPNGDVIVGGTFPEIDRVPAQNLAVYNYTTGTWRPLGAGADAIVRTIAVLPTGEVAVGGGFTTIGGISASRIALYSPATDTWRPLGDGLDGDAYTVAWLANEELLVGGSFRVAGGNPADGAAKYSFADHTWRPVLSSPGAIITSVTARASGELLVAGGFERVSGVPSRRITLIRIPSPSITDHPDDATVISGSSVELSAAVAAPDTNAYRWQKDGEVLADGPLYSGASTPTLTINARSAAQSGAYRLVASDECGAVASRPAWVDVVCLADVDRDGAIDSDDTIAFFDLWSAGAAGADVNGDATVDGEDVITYFARFDEGC